jgi:hypothetical protein
MNMDSHTASKPTLPLTGTAPYGFKDSYFEELAGSSVVRKVRAAWAEIDRLLSPAVRNLQQFQVYDEDAFQYLLTNECKRSERSGHSFKVLLAYFTMPDGSTRRMESTVAHRLLMGLSQNLRETDYVGWYCDGHIIGGVLTAFGQEQATNSSQFEQRIIHKLQAILSKERVRSLQMRVFKHHELQRIDSGKEALAIS